MKWLKQKIRLLTVYVFDKNTITRIIIAFLRVRLYIYIKRHLYSNEFSRLKQFKGVYSGKRVFVIATGPSLTLSDLEKLNEEYTFGMNSIVNLYEKTSWRPTFYGICDGSVYSRIKDKIRQYFDKEIVFYNHYGIRWDSCNAYPVPTKAGWGSYDDLRALHLRPPKDRGHTSSDIERYVYAGAHVGHFVLQICFYMGFSEIYLLGTDCSNIGKYANGTGYSDGNITGNERDFVLGMIADYESDKKFAEFHGIRIYNATRGGALELFERVNLDKVLEKKK